MSSFQYHKQPRVTLVGAGPGDPDLITLKGLKAIESADIVLYDALVSDQILKMIPAVIPKMSVGKRAGAHSFSQDGINQLIVEFAFLYGHVVRLKGGDPNVFGRAAEEIEHATLHGIDTVIVPGISSAIAAPSSLNIPVTMRGVSESFWVVTGTTAQGEISSDLKWAAQSSATVIVLMGMNKLNEIMTVFSGYGKSDTAVAIVQNASLPSQQMVVGNVANIEDLVAQEGIGAPAVIVIGNVVKYGRELQKVLKSQMSQV